MKSKKFNFNSFALANKEKKVSGLDYLQIVYKSEELDSDFILWFARLFYPKFKVVDGMVFISELFDSEHYKETLNNNCSKEKVQYWLNLLEITGLFDDLATQDAMNFAEYLTSLWNLKLHNEFPETQISARTIYDTETDEVFVTIDHNTIPIHP
tara:strand:- start:1183 stop:1644 length:462 start_codon:yes stop_codon:yes gene_type:complete